ncbi:MAG: hypothetical protein JNM56_34970 [Planctomycetia bacterium]|nr:hypothetical protein [Planctomycetia bacterium]
MLDLLRQLEVHPVLVDVGAAGSPPAVWEPIAPRSVYVGFDPAPAGNEARALDRYSRAHLIERAVSPTGAAAELPLFITRLRCCSSTLPPRQAALGDHSFAPLFEVERETIIEAVSLAEALTSHGLQRLDWLKVDSQGTDLSIYRSLPGALRRTVLALDIEPGLIDAYAGEDLFADCHAALTAEGFWLSRLDLQGTQRIRQTTLEHLCRMRPDLSPEHLQQHLRPSPGWCNARYLRTIPWLHEHAAPPSDGLLLGCFALLDQQPGFALDVALDLRQHFGTEPRIDALHDTAIAQLLGPCETPRRWLRRLTRGVGELAHALLS